MHIILKAIRLCKLIAMKISRKLKIETKILNCKTDIFFLIKYVSESKTCAKKKQLQRRGGGGSLTFVQCAFKPVSPVGYIFKILIS